MKIIHFSDTHIGIESQGLIDPETKLNIRTLDVLDGIDAMIDMAIEENVDVVLFTGDAFHRSNPPQNYVNEFGKRMSRLRKHCPVVLLVGNHDMPGGDRSSTLEIYKTLEVEDIIVGKYCEYYEIETKSGEYLQVVTIPYPNRSWLDVKDSIRNKTEIGESLKDETRKRILELSKQVNSEMPAILMGHFTAEGSNFGAERSMVVSNLDASVSLDELTLPIWDYVALGHIHKHQNITEGMEGLPPVVYSGSMDRVDFGEEHEPKGFVLLEINSIDHAKQVHWEFVDALARPFQTLEYRAVDKNSTQKIIDKINLRDDLEGAIVRVIITPKDELSRLSLDDKEISNVIIKKGAFAIKSFLVKRAEEVADDKINARETTLNISMNKKEMLIAYLDSIDKPDKELISIFENIVHTCEVK
jgi:exonuclease SbcD